MAKKTDLELLDEANAQIADLNTQVATLTQERDTAIAAQQTLECEKTQLTADLETAKQTISDLTKRAEDAEQKTTTLTSEKDAVTKERDDAKQELAKAREGNARFGGATPKRTDAAQKDGDKDGIKILTGMKKATAFFQQRLDTKAAA